MKILALDLGDRWVGTAVSDPLGITCRPYQTVELSSLADFLTKTISKEHISTVLVGHPRTFGGEKSRQTVKVEEHESELAKQFDVVAGRKITWILWDERLSSKRAEQLRRRLATFESKRESHSLAAAFILQSYLDSLALRKGE